jgi:CheY-like chemotaxis protein
VRILHIEPSEADARWLDLTLREWGGAFEIRLFSTVMDALAKVGDFPCDLLIVNSRLPAHELPEAMTKLRAAPCVRRARVAVTVGGSDEVPRLEGVDWYWTKPVSVDEIKGPLSELENEIASGVGAD